MSDWLAAAVLLAVVIWLIAPQQLPVSLYKLSLVAMAAVVGYWIDRSLFPYARPDALLESLENEDDTLLRLVGTCMLRRAVIVAAVVVAVSLGA